MSKESILLSSKERTLLRSAIEVHICFIETGTSCLRASDTTAAGCNIQARILGSDQYRLINALEILKTRLEE